MATGKGYYRGKRDYSARSLKRPIRCSPIPRRTIPRGWTDAGLMGEAEVPLLTDECGEAGCSIRTTEVTDWAESKWQWRHLVVKNLQCFKKGEQQREKEGFLGRSDGSKREGRHDRTIAGERKERVKQ